MLIIKYTQTAPKARYNFTKGVSRDVPHRANGAHLNHPEAVARFATDASHQRRDELVSVGVYDYV